MPRGGKRVGAGKPKGYKHAPSAKAMAKADAREYARLKITKRLDRILDAQMDHAEGVKYLVARHRKTGKFAKLTEQLMQAIVSGENPEYEAIEVWSKDPSTQAAQDLLNRALDKPAEHVELTGADKGPLEIIVRKPW